MGSCVSTNKHLRPPKLRRRSSRSTRTPPSVDVETVKEVLSETPNPKPIINIKDDHKTIPSGDISYKLRPFAHFSDDPNISEIDSTMSENVDNVSTTTFDEDDNDVYRRKVVNISPAKSRHRNQVSGELPAVRKSPVKSPVRVVERSPGRNGRETGFGSSGRNRAVSGNVPACRSRSPVKRAAVGGGGEIGRSLSGRRAGKSPGRVGSDLHERVRKPELRSPVRVGSDLNDRVRKHEIGSGRVREQSGPSGRFQAGQNKDESLDNPLVSLECFIFL